MPLYDYDCAACGRRFELVHGVHAEPPTVCPLCGSGPIRKAISAPAIHYKGSGWAKRDRRATAKSGASSGTSDESSSDAGSSDAAATSETPKAETPAKKTKSTEPATATSTD